MTGGRANLGGNKFFLGGGGGGGGSISCYMPWNLHGGIRGTSHSPNIDF